MGVDETGTLGALKQHRTELLDAKIAEHQGSSSSPATAASSRRVSQGGPTGVIYRRS
jgi:hypothetical protein